MTVALMALTASDTEIRRGVAMLVAGVLGVCAGAGIGPVWLATAGPSLEAFAGVAALVAGSLLLVAGTWLVVRAAPGWWRLAAIPVAFLVIQLVLIPLSGAVYGTHPPRTPMSASRPPAAQDVLFTTPDGVTLAAWYTPSRNGAAIILLPGSGGDKGSTCAHGEILAEHGYGVLALDARGSGDSMGVGNAWGWHGTADVTGATSWLQSRTEVEPKRIGALGLSMGGEQAITAAAAGVGLHAVVAEGVSARVPADLDYLPRDASGVIQRLEGGIMWTVADLMTDATPPIPLTQAVPVASDVPMLLIVGNDPNDAGAAPALMAAAPSLEVWNVPDTPHIQSLALHAEEWESRVVGFFDESL